ncbi:hypothetical protein D9758_014270, partial [Tetrapyrgos nigripes]
SSSSSSRSDDDSSRSRSSILAWPNFSSAANRNDSSRQRGRVVAYSDDSDSDSDFGISEDDLGVDYHSDSTCDTDVEDEFGGPTSLRHPSNILNDYLLEQIPDCKVAITHDNDWCQLLEECDSGMPLNDELIVRAMSKYDIVTESDCAFFEKRPTAPALPISNPSESNVNLRTDEQSEDSESSVMSAGTSIIQQIFYCPPASASNDPDYDIFLSPARTHRGSSFASNFASISSSPPEPSHLHLLHLFNRNHNFIAEKILFEILEQKITEILEQLKSFPAYADALFKPDELDDRLLLQEKLLVLMTRLGDSSSSEREREIAQDLQAFVIDFLYKNLPHPPSAYLSALVQPDPSVSTATNPNKGAYVKYAYRAADGSNYNPLIPRFGAAGQPYARTVPSTTLLTPMNTLPDPGLVFDTLLKRPKGEKGNKPHPSGGLFSSNDLDQSTSQISLITHGLRDVSSGNVFMSPLSPAGSHSPVEATWSPASSSSSDVFPDDDSSGWSPAVSSPSSPSLSPLNQSLNNIALNDVVDDGVPFQTMFRQRSSSFTGVQDFSPDQVLKQLRSASFDGSFFSEQLSGQFVPQSSPNQPFIFPDNTFDFSQFSSNLNVAPTSPSWDSVDSSSQQSSPQFPPQSSPQLLAQQQFYQPPIGPPSGHPTHGRSQSTHLTVPGPSLTRRGALIIPDIFNTNRRDWSINNNGRLRADEQSKDPETSVTNQGTTHGRSQSTHLTVPGPSRSHRGATHKRAHSHSGIQDRGRGMATLRDPRARHGSPHSKKRLTIPISSPIVGVVDLTKYVRTTSREPDYLQAYSDIYWGEWEKDVSKSRERTDTVRVAIKLLRVRYDEVKVQKRLDREVYIWHRLDHPNIATFLGALYHMSDRPALVLPWLSNGCASEHLRRNPHRDRLQLILDVVRGLHYLQTKEPPVVHGDLKGNNILISDEGRATLSDFGLAQVIEQIGVVSAIRWQAPELLQDDTGHPKMPGDIYSFDCTCYEPLTRNIPYHFRARDPLVQDIQSVIRPPGFEENSRRCRDKGIWDLMNDCPEERFQITDLSHI